MQMVFFSLKKVGGKCCFAVNKEGKGGGRYRVLFVFAFWGWGWS